MIPFPGYTPIPPLMRMNPPVMEEIPGPKLAHAYVPDQPYSNMFPLHEALMKGTIFPNLCMPYKPRKDE